MIKLTFQLHPHPVERIYNKNRVIVGLGSDDLSDLPLSQAELDAEHLVILESDGYFWAINHANDPFMTLNDIPFGKKRLRNGDRLIVSDIELIFEGELSRRSTADIEKMLDLRLKGQDLHAGEEPWRNRKNASWQQRAEHSGSGANTSVQSLLEQVEALAPSESRN